jgi:nucleoid-associated protein YgaU
MASVAQAVLEFDEAVQVPWRPPLASVPAPAPPLAPGALPGGAAGDRRRPHASRAARSERPGPVGGAHPVAAGVGARARPGCPRCGSPGACAAPPVRLTRRARRLAAVALTAAVVGLGGWVGALAQDGEALQLASGTSTVVREGDTLWSIARSVAGGADVRVVVDDIRRLNDLGGTTLVPGQVLRLP